MLIEYPSLCISYAAKNAIFLGPLFVSKPIILTTYTFPEAIVNSLLLQDEQGNFDIIV